MKNKLFYIFLAFIFFSCNEIKNSTSTPPVDDNCKNVPKLNWQTESTGLDAESTFKLLSEIKVAAEADLAKSRELNASGKAEVNVQSELAKAVSKNVTQSQTVTQEFWEQELTFRQILCYYDSKINDINTPEDIKRKFYDATLEISKIRIDYTFEEKKRSGKSQN